MSRSAIFADEAGIVLARHRNLLAPSPRRRAFGIGVPAAALLGMAFSVWWLGMSAGQIGNGIGTLAKFVAIMIPPATGGHLHLFLRGMAETLAIAFLVMLILIGTVPTTYALNKAMPASQMEEFSKSSAAAADIVAAKGAGYSVLGNPRPAVTLYVAQHQLTEGTYPSLAMLIRDIDRQVKQYGSFDHVPPDQVGNTRNDMYLTSEALRLLAKDKENDLSAGELTTLGAYRKSLDNSTKFIPTWVKVAVAIALGLGTMVGWKRIVVTVGEKIGKEHLTYAQGASAELVAMGTIFAADAYGLPVSTTHVLSSGVAGTMAANGSGLQPATVRSLIMAWVLTLPAAIMLSGSLYALFVWLF